MLTFVSQMLGIVAFTIKVTKKVCKKKKEKQVVPIVIRKTVLNPKPKNIIFARKRSKSF